jgi:hypothetical protein
MTAPWSGRHAAEKDQNGRLEVRDTPYLQPALLSYAAGEDIALHSEVLNLKSSQAACFNFLFPLRIDLALANAALRSFLPGLREVTAIEFEYTGPPGVTAWLSEPRGGKRGQNRTSIDAAIFWIDKKEHIYGCPAGCSGSRRRFTV